MAAAEEVEAADHPHRRHPVPPMVLARRPSATDHHVDWPGWRPADQPQADSHLPLLRHRVPGRDAILPAQGLPLREQSVALQHMRRAAKQRLRVQLAPAQQEPPIAATVGRQVGSGLRSLPARDLDGPSYRNRNRNRSGAERSRFRIFT